VQRKNDVRPVTDCQMSFHLDAGRLQGVDFFEQRSRIDDDSVADHGQFAGPQDAAGNQLQDKLTAADVDGVAGVVAALVSRHYVESLREQVNDLTFAFIAPLGAKHNEIAHDRGKGTKLSHCNAPGMLRWL